MGLRNLIGPSLGLAALLGVAACSSGSSGNNDNNAGPTGSSPRDVIAVGAITGFGSVFVNGSKYEVSASTRIAVEDEMETMGDDSVLRLGMKVRVKGREDDGVRTAEYIEYDDDLEGPIDSITPDPADPTIGTFTVLEQTVIVDADTAFDDVGDNDGIPGIDIRDLQIGMVVEVSGFPTDAGFLATLVDRELDDDGDDPEYGRPDVDGDELELKGFVEAVADDNSTITVSGVVFIVNSNTELDDGIVLGPGLIGAFVEVEADIVGDDYVAVEIEREDDFYDDDREGEFEIEGVLQAVDTDSMPNTFTIDGLTVPVTNAAPLAAFVGLHVEIEGSFNADGVLVIDEFEEEQDPLLELEDLVATVDRDGASFTTRLGIVVSPTGGSRVEDDALDDDDHLTVQQFIDRLQMGDRIEAYGFEDTSGVVWTRVEREELAAENDDFECELRGPVESVDGDAFSFVILGVTVTTGRMEEDDFQDDEDDSIGRDEFFNRLAVGTIVEAESFEGDAYCMEGMLDATEVELEPNGDD